MQHQFTPLHWASNFGAVSVVEYLVLQLGGDIGARTDVSIKSYLLSSIVSSIAS
jgi:ankyrin repeat protein